VEFILGILMTGSLCILTLLCSALANTTLSEPTTIMAVQGQKVSSSYQGKEVAITGVVTAVVPTPIGKDVISGFYFQDSQGDNDPLTSDGIFIVTKNVPYRIGDTLAVTGAVTEHHGFTQIIPTVITSVKTTKPLAATPLISHPDDINFNATLERYEGMLVVITPPSKLVVTRSLSFDRTTRRNNLALSYQQPNYHPNQSQPPSAASSSQRAQGNQQNTLTVESLQQAKGANLPWYPLFATTTDFHIRIGDGVKALQGVIGYSNGHYRLFVTKQANENSFEHLNHRTSQPTLKQGNLSVATFNLLNYFNSPFGGASNPAKQNRGARNPSEFANQATKIVSALVALDADIVGLMEIENNGYGEDSAIQDLVNRLNAKLPTNKHYKFGQLTSPQLATSQFISQDAITNGVIYRPSQVTLTHIQLIEMPKQRAPKIDKESGHNSMRDALTPTFTINIGGQQLTISINHFKSKGSTCWEDVALEQYNDTDLQGSCEHLRVSAAYQLGTALAEIKGHKLIVGDLNSYGKEDPLLVLTNRHNVAPSYAIEAARDTFINNQRLHGASGAVIDQTFGYINTVAINHPTAFGYSYKNSVGTLDYILASPSLTPYIIDAVEWPINSPESPLLQYSTKYTGEMTKFNDPYRSSDHDPVIISLRF